MPRPETATDKLGIAIEDLTDIAGEGTDTRCGDIVTPELLDLLRSGIVLTVAPSMWWPHLHETENWEFTVRSGAGERFLALDQRGFGPLAVVDPKEIVVLHSVTDVFVFQLWGRLSLVESKGARFELILWQITATQPDLPALLKRRIRQLQETVDWLRLEVALNHAQQ